MAARLGHPVESVGCFQLAFVVLVSISKFMSVMSWLKFQERSVFGQLKTHQK